MSKFFLEDQSAPYVLYQTDTGRRRGNPTLVLSLSEEQARDIAGLLASALPKKVVRKEKASTPKPATNKAGNKD